MRVPTTFTATLSPDGRITLAFPPGVEIPQEAISVMTELAGDDAPIAVASCLPPDQVEAIAQRLASLLLGRA